jgi:allantoicase
VIRLGTPGVITSIDVDTSFFTGNHPQSISIEACGREGYPGSAELAGASAFWHEIVPKSVIAGDSHNTFAVIDERRFTHVRLSAYPTAESPGSACSAGSCPIRAASRN